MTRGRRAAGRWAQTGLVIGGCVVVAAQQAPPPSAALDDRSS